MDSLLDNMVLMRPQRIFKCERDNVANSMIKRGLKHVKDIRLNKVIPDEVAPLSVKDPIS
jgi:uncharacterized protein HemY